MENRILEEDEYFDDREPRPHAIEKRVARRGAAAVMGDFEHVASEAAIREIELRLGYGPL